MRHRSTARTLYELLSSMRFAISLLSILAIASVIGTVLKQNEPYNNYLNQFGPFWFPVFEKLGLYAVYNSVWFLVILGFLVISTTACILRQAKPMVKDMQSYREHAREASLAQFQHHARFPIGQTSAASQTRILDYLQRQGFRSRVNPREGAVLIAARQGSWTRIGYFLAHGAIVLICIGGLLDGNLPLKLQMLLGDKRITNGNQLISDIPESSRLGLDNWSFRGNVFIPEGKSARQAVLNVQDGVLLQDLPFAVSLRKFHLEHYSTGMPKRFASDIVVTDLRSGQSFEKTIEVNKPFEVAGITLYQASFEDGGSHLTLRSHALAPQPQEATRPLKVDVGDSLALQGEAQGYTLELGSFRPFNIENMADETAPAEGSALERHLGSGARSSARKDMQNVGPSIQYKLRDNAGQAREYMNYMQPIEQDGARYFLAGMRTDPALPFRYMRIPVDANNTPDSWFALRRTLLDPARHTELARRFSLVALGPDTSDTMRARMQETALKTLDLFARGGFEALGKFIESTIPAAERDKAADIFLKILEGSAWEAWRLQHPDAPKTPDATLDRFLRDSLNSMSDSLHYGAPVYLQLDGFEEVRATVLQATRSPGKPLVYLGSLLLVLGVFAMLYVRERRLFVLVKDQGEALLALSSNRKSMDVDQDFARHRDALAQLLDARPAASPNPAPPQA
ncbi:cytochrome c biogenesis protein ResB [Zoogloea sp.]|uniref:cytochrome c biogenesis protein ResB n=1 Tax=Zoogloea sp. TaxID=49181 RepID=UPI0035ADA43A